jgi:hypothetical protein
MLIASLREVEAYGALEQFPVCDVEVLDTTGARATTAWRPGAAAALHVRKTLAQIQRAGGHPVCPEFVATADTLLR